MRYSIFLSAAAALALAACAQTETTEETAATETAETTAGEPAATGAMAESAPGTAAGAQGFVDQAAASDMFEIEAGKLAQQKGTDPAIKAFGAMMVSEHTKSTADLKTAASEAGGLTVAPKLNPKQQSDFTALQGASGNFDALYKQQQVAAHEAALALLQAQAASGDAAPLKAFAAKTAPVVEKHLDEARKLP